jgi:hypothetical protein
MTSKAERLSLVERAKFLAVMTEGNLVKRTCEHGHPICSDGESGPCLHETLRLVQKEAFEEDVSGAPETDPKPEADGLAKSLGEVAEKLADLISDMIKRHDGRLIPCGERNPWIDIYSLNDAAAEIERAIMRFDAFAKGEDPPSFDEPLRENEDT